MELVATGMANAVGALFGSMLAGGGTSQTAVNRLTGARTPLADIVTAAAVAPPDAAASVARRRAHAARRPGGHRDRLFRGLIRLVDFRDILRIRVMEFVWAMAGLLGVVLLGTFQGILVAIIVSLVPGRKPSTNVLRRVLTLPAPPHPSSTTPPPPRTPPGSPLKGRPDRRLHLAARATVCLTPAALDHIRFPSAPSPEESESYGAVSALCRLLSPGDNGIPRPPCRPPRGSRRAY